MNGLVISSEPAVEPITTATAKTHLRVDHSNDDTFIDTLITASRKHVERFLGRALITQTWEAYWDCFPSTNNSDWWSGTKTGHINMFTGARNYLEVPMPPLQSVDKLSTYGTDNSETTFAATNYYLDTTSIPGRVVLNDGQTWPTDLRERNSVYLKFVCGYGAAGTNVPQDILIGLQMYIAYLYEHRGDQDKSVMLPSSVRTILDPYRNLKTVI